MKCNQQEQNRVDDFRSVDYTIPYKNKFRIKKL